MTRRPQVLRVTDSATTSSTSRRQLSQPAAVSPPLVSPPLSPSPEASPQPADSPLGSPRPGSPASPASEHHRTFVSQSSVTLRGVPVYDEYLCADHRWVRPVAPLRPRSESTTSTTAESEEDSAGTGATAGSSSSSCGSSYVTWTKSSLRSKQWQMLHSPSASGRRGAEAPAQPAASRILKDELVETGGEEGCVAVLAPCPGPAAPASPAVSLLTLAPKSDGRPPPARTRSDAQRHQRHHSEFDGLLQYLQDYRHGLRELLVNNNVVIIEPVRASQAKRHSAELRDDRRAHSAPGEDHRGDKACRITGAIVKSPEKDSGTGTHTAHAGRGSNSNNTLPRSQKPHQPILRRQFFYQDLLLKINKELVDAELPDPDTVRNARKVFERAAPLGVGKAGLGLSGLSGLSHSHSGLDKRMCWTDSGSLSSGVSSDLSCCDLSCDTDHHHLRSLRSLRSTGTCSSGSLSLSQQEVFSSGDESEADQPHPKAPRTAAAAPPPPVPAEAAALSADGNPVSEDVLQKIRACGTTVTYFGGQVIACSGAGPVRSPMTMAIMEEIRRSARPIMLGGPLGVSLGASLGASLGIKFRLVKSNSCGSRLELAGQTVGGGGRWPRPARSHAAPTTPAASMASTASTTSTASAASTTSTASAATPAPTPTEAPAPAVNFPMANRNRQVEEQVVSVDIGDSLTDSLSSEDARNSSTTTASSCGAGEGVNTSPHDESPTVDVKEFVNARNAELRKSDARNGPVRNGDLRKTEVKRNGGSEDKENRPVVGITSWKMNGKDIKTLEDLRRPSVPPIPLPAVPQQQDKFGTMEFEEFQFIE
ncbi:uncharacterized protein LOC113203893 [Frankliniella occidentalis]|uniref:Uncharacterized protein LOC113203893 n=1 Tax=Frankliniella occidentalis TaxID=133901 RepID=A0A9C6U376_FRAOC|nr:uncharacterized protein LOC113203893 [Frankliniella occidentalis]